MIIDGFPSRFPSSGLCTGCMNFWAWSDENYVQLCNPEDHVKVTLSGNFLHGADGISEFMGTHAGFMRPCKNQMVLLAIQNVSVTLACHVNLLLTYMRTIILIKQRMLITCHSRAFSSGKQGKCEGALTAPEQFVCNCHIVNECCVWWGHQSSQQMGCHQSYTRLYTKKWWFIRVSRKTLALHNQLSRASQEGALSFSWDVPEVTAAAKPQQGLRADSSI